LKHKRSFETPRQELYRDCTLTKVPRKGTLGSSLGLPRLKSLGGLYANGAATGQAGRGVAIYNMTMHTNRRSRVAGKRTTLACRRPNWESMQGETVHVQVHCSKLELHGLRIKPRHFTRRSKLRAFRGSQKLLAETVKSASRASRDTSGSVAPHLGSPLVKVRPAVMPHMGMVTTCVPRHRTRTKPPAGLEGAFAGPTPESCPSFFVS
jgi:hypothetical protein